MDERSWEPLYRVMVYETVDTSLYEQPGQGRMLLQPHGKEMFVTDDLPHAIKVRNTLRGQGVECRVEVL